MSFSQGLAKIRENEESRAKATPIAMVAPELKQNTEDTEISKACAVLGCEESKNLNSDSFFRFPEDPGFRQIWTDLTGRNNWTPTDYSYICVQHFSVDCFECDADNSVVLNSKAVPSLKLPKHVLEVEYIDDETLDNEYEDDYDDDGDQDDDMENDAEDNKEYEEHLHEEHLEEDDFGEEINNFEEIHQNQQHYSLQNQLQHQQEYLQQIQIQHQQHPKEKQIQQQSRYPQDKQKQHQQQNEYKQQQPQKYQQKSEKQQNQKQIISSNVKRNVSNIKYLTNGTPNHTTEKPSSSHTTADKVHKLNKIKEQENVELLKLFTEVQMMQKQVTGLKGKLTNGMRIYKRQKRCLARLKEEIDIKKNLVVQRRKKKSRILLSLQDKIREDTNGLVLAMPTRHTEDLKNFALSIYKYSPQAYIYIRNTLRTLLPSTDVLDSWVSSGYEPTNVLTNSNMVRVVSELTDSALSCKVSIR